MLSAWNKQFQHKQFSQCYPEAFVAALCGYFRPRNQTQNN